MYFLLRFMFSVWLCIVFDGASKNVFIQIHQYEWRQMFAEFVFTRTVILINLDAIDCVSPSS